MIQTKSYAANTHVANVPCSSQKGLAKETFAELKADGLNNSIVLPNLAKGLYFIHVNADGQILPTQKLSIQ